jgi:hypothetical protein
MTASGNRAPRRRQKAGRIIPAPHPNIGRASEADREWFAARPWRSHHIRPALPFELPGISGEHEGVYIVVRQAMPGVRFRTVMTWEMPEVPPDYEALGHALFDTLAEHAAAGSPWGTRLNLAALFERVMRMAAGGRA